MKALLNWISTVNSILSFRWNITYSQHFHFAKPLCFPTLNFHRHQNSSQCSYGFIEHIGLNFERKKKEKFELYRMRWEINLFAKWNNHNISPKRYYPEHYVSVFNCIFWRSWRERLHLGDDPRPAGRAEELRQAVRPAPQVSRPLQTRVPGK